VGTRKEAPADSISGEDLCDEATPATVAAETKSGVDAGLDDWELVDEVLSLFTSSPIYC
jgi:hypothetical protein